MLAAGAAITTTSGPAVAAPASPDRAAVRGGPDEQYSVRDVVVDRDGTRHVRYDRKYRGLEVLGGDFVVHSAAGGRVIGTTVAQDQVIKVPAKPAASEKKVAADFQGKRTLVVDAAAGRPVLAWRIAGPGVEYIVDATTGALRRQVDDLRTAGAAGTGHGLLAGDVALTTTQRPDGRFELVDEDRGNSETRNGENLNGPAREQTTAFVDADNTWGDGTIADPATLAVDVQHGVRQTWDYFLETYGRNGIADDGRGALAVVHDRSADGNASWSDSCFCLRFGAGDSFSKALTSQDIVAHEWAHGVTGATADLEYWGQSGALNESASDIFGTLVEFAAANPADPPDYLVGELTDFGGEGLPLRYLDDPARDGESIGCWDGDVRDVHYLSGVPNKFFYTLAEGSAKSEWGESKPCEGAAPVTGIGRDKAGAIWYHALTRYMVSTTDFAEARDATLRSATDLYGKTSSEYAAVAAAWTAVHVESKPPAAQYPVIAEIENRVDRAGEPVRLQVEASDPNEEPLTFTAEGLPQGLTMSGSGLITGTPVEDKRVVTSIKVADPGGLWDSTVFIWDIQAPPVITGPGPQKHRAGDSVLLSLEATDVDLVTWTVTGLPDGLTANDYGRITGTPTREGTYEVTATATDRDGAASSVVFAWTITEAPPAAPVPYLLAFWSDADVVVYWSSPTSDYDSIKGYELTISPGGPTVLVEDGYTQSTTIPDLDPAQVYTASVVVVYRDGRRSAPTTADVWAE